MERKWSRWLRGPAASSCAFCLAACTPLLRTPTSVGVGAFWDVESEDQGAVTTEQYKGVGLVVSRASLSAGWMDVTRVEVDTEAAPSGSVQVGPTRLYWGAEAEEAGALAVARWVDDRSRRTTKEGD